MDDRRDPRIDAALAEILPLLRVVLVRHVGATPAAPRQTLTPVLPDDAERADPVTRARARALLVRHGLRGRGKR